MLLSEWKGPIEEIGRKVEELRGSLDVAEKEKQIGRLEKVTESHDLWEDPQAAQKVMQDLTVLRGPVDQYYGLKNRFNDAYALWELGMEENDDSIQAELEGQIKELEHDLEQLQLSLMLSGEYDANNAILTLHAGAGGTEAQDWAQMLLRMYVRWAERNRYKVETMDFQDGEEAGVKSATLLISGLNVYGYLKAEKGVHRLVRISPFDSNARRHTSFAAIDVMPEIDDNVQIEIRSEDLRVDTYRASGAGGQHINKTDSAVRMTHLPTGSIVQCQSERSQIQNREQCMRLLRSRLFELERERQAAEKAEIAGDYQKIEWGSQIRSYVFHPYSMVKDHRTGYEVGNVQAVMDGDLDGFIEAYLKQKAL
ncbi:MAG TPA: peptide chain release factor 2 [Negativicutes bacterium]|nr:peptide chain release factor 2 [Negativicutes bacterium]